MIQVLNILLEGLGCVCMNSHLTYSSTYCNLVFTPSYHWNCSCQSQQQTSKDIWEHLILLLLCHLPWIEWQIIILASLPTLRVLSLFQDLHAWPIPTMLVSPKAGRDPSLITLHTILWISHLLPWLCSTIYMLMIFKSIPLAPISLMSLRPSKTVKSHNSF